MLCHKIITGWIRSLLNSYAPVLCVVIQTTLQTAAEEGSTIFSLSFAHNVCFHFLEMIYAKFTVS